MTPKEKAKEIFDKFKFVYIPNYTSNHEVKECAIIAVQEVVSQWEYIDTYLADYGGEFNINLKYWQEVLEEIEKL